MNFIPHFKGRQLFLPKSELPIMSLARTAFFASMVAMVASLVLWSAVGLNFGVDFKGGSMIEVRAKADQADIADLRANMSVCGAVRYDHAVSLLTRHFRDLAAETPLCLCVEETWHATREDMLVLRELARRMGDANTPSSAVTARSRESWRRPGPAG